MNPTATGSLALLDIKMTALVLPGEILLYGGFGLLLFRTIQGRSDLEVPFERVVIGFIAIHYYPMASEWLTTVSALLTSAITKLGDRDDLKQFVLESIKEAANTAFDSNSSSNGAYIAGALTQALRTGVWGVMSAVVDAIFLITTFLLNSAHETLWAILLFLFPVTCGLYPVAPRLFGNLSLYAIELSLWSPMLAMIELITSQVARKQSLNTESLGLTVVAAEILAVGLILSIPAITHRFLSGAFSGDFDSHVRFKNIWKKFGGVSRLWRS